MTVLPDWHAIEIAQDLLERSGKSYFENDFDLFRSCFQIPQEFETFGGKRRISTVEELRALFDGMLKYFKDNGITGLHRRVIAARFLSEDSIQSTHEAQFITDKAQIGSPYPVMSILEKRGTDWKVVRGSYALLKDPGHELAFNVGTVIEPG
ncbi:hypothetical protein [Pacificoceanicola onchidii]|uniref:hypothetical protein n=1 Tax=Pacificoceanicola onchidii TaxID=2562685 RepID=UPI0010A3C78E|nr:hypothetical protein [Pacificoceanicola onchidii]